MISQVASRLRSNMSIDTIEKSDLEPIIARHQSGGAFSRVLDQVQSPADLIRVLACYIHFNATFGGGVANLAGETAIRQNLFRTADEEVKLIADRSAEVASDIFFAAIDEFDDRATFHRDTHRSLAQATLKATGAFFGYTPQALDRLIWINDATTGAIRQVQEGYCVNRSVTEDTLFQAIGFHIGSEILADDEFNVFDRFLRNRYAELVTHLENSKVEIDGVKHAAYYWVHVHTSVEADHFGAAVKAANRSLRYYAGGENTATVKEWIIEGFGKFAEVQGRFMDGLIELLDANGKSS